MLRWRNHGDTAVLALESRAEGAGAAFVCAYGSSAEFDAALIAARRAAGVYGPKRRRKRMLVLAATVGVGVLAFTLLII